MAKETKDNEPVDFKLVMTIDGSEHHKKEIEHTNLPLRVAALWQSKLAGVESELAGIQARGGDVFAEEK